MRTMTASRSQSTGGESSYRGFDFDMSANQWTRMGALQRSLVCNLFRGE